jgi:hypothetical protein
MDIVADDFELAASQNATRILDSRIHGLPRPMVALPERNKRHKVRRIAVRAAKESEHRKRDAEVQEIHVGTASNLDASD